jgi:GDPmannose 4,6-dehydratase
MFACNGILFNHESPLRGETFVTRKISRAVSKIALNMQDVLYLGNLNARRDWGHAKDYVEGMWKMLQVNSPEDFVLATGVTTSVRDFVKLAFLQLGIELEFIGINENEIGIVSKCNNLIKLPIGKEVVKVDKAYYRPTEVDLLIGDPTKAKQKLNWEPKYNLQMIVKEMVESDYEYFKKQ